MWGGLRRPPLPASQGGVLVGPTAEETLYVVVSDDLAGSKM